MCAVVGSSRGATKVESAAEQGQPAVALVYDAKGNLTDDGSYVYAYDHENRLVKVYRKDTPENELLL